MTATIAIVVLETEQIAQATVTPQEITIPVGESVNFEYSINSQFGTPIQSISVPFHATQPGDTTLYFYSLGIVATANVHIIAYDQYNLALGKPVEASGSEWDGTKPTFAVDGLLDTRWSSRFQDNEWIAVDLGQCYQLHTLTLRWENAYATEYDVQLSDDGIEYTTIQTITNAKGGVQNIDLRTNNQTTPARFVRVYCKKRNTGYGASLWELEVYGSGFCGANPSTDLDQPQTSPTVRKILINNHIYILHPNGIYDLTGRLLEGLEFRD